MKDLTLTKDEAETLMVMFDCIEHRQINSLGCQELWNAYGDLMDVLSDRWHEASLPRYIRYCGKHTTEEVVATPGGKCCTKCVQEETYCEKHPAEPILYFFKNGKGDCLECAEERFSGQ
jgi:hypothetical protein